MRTLFTPFVFLGVFILGFCFALQAKEPPNQLLHRLTNEMIKVLREQDQQLQNNPQLIYKIVDKIIVPHIDWSSMANWVIGRQIWLKSPQSQRDRFEKEFRDLLIRTYASTLRAYNNQTIDYLPIRGGFEGKSRVQVISLIKEPGRAPIRVTYRLIDKGGEWKVYDISIEGVSLLQGFQSQFESEIRQHGFEALINRLHTHNEKPLLEK